VRRLVRLLLARDALPDGLAGAPIQRHHHEAIAIALWKPAARCVRRRRVDADRHRRQHEHRSPQTTGDDEPRPGISTFQRMFLVSLHSVGGVADRDTPVANGPRHWGQKRSRAAAPAAPPDCAPPDAAATTNNKNEMRARAAMIPQSWCPPFRLRSDGL
jgi:hypothetical protein